MNTYDQIRIEKDIEISKLNEIFKKLVQNDTQLIPSTQTSPKIWECKWFNDDSVGGYKKGDAVWLNCDEPQDFINRNKGEIIGYIENSQKYQYRYNQVKDDSIALNELLLEVINSNELYFLGDITQKVQVRVCIATETKSKPTNNKYWDDFWKQTNREACQKYILDNSRKSCEDMFTTHVKDYHLSGLTKTSFDNYLKVDMSNVDYGSKYFYYSHRNKVYGDGFDYVKQQHTSKISDGCVRWFRLWSSGYLEHGGTVNVNNPQMGDLRNQDMYEVNLTWTYGSKTAPSFDYIIKGLNRFYKVDKVFNIYENDIEMRNAEKILYSDNTYNVQICPIQCTNPYQSYTASHAFYDLQEINCICNGRFSFAIDGQYNRYSYYASGFTIAS